MFSSQSAGEGSSIKNKADAEIDRILKEQYERGMELLTTNRDVLDTVAMALIEKEKISGTQMLELIKQVNPKLVTQDALDKVAEVTNPIVAALSPPSEEPVPVPIPAEG